MFFTDLFLPSTPTKDFCKEVALIHQNVSCPHTAAKLAPATHPTLGMAPENADLSCFGVALLAHWCIHWCAGVLHSGQSGGYWLHGELASTVLAGDHTAH